MARIGIIHAGEDDNLSALARAISELGREVAWIDTSDFCPERRFSFHDARCAHNGDFLEDVAAFFVRSVMSPMPYVDARDGGYHLYDDWFQDYMRAREKHGFLLSWMLTLHAQGKHLVNPPLLATMNPLKPFQLATLKAHGLPTPRTLITNDPAEVRAFHAEVGETIFKPVVGGAYCRRLDAEALEYLDEIAKSPVIFQEYVPGPNVRVTALPGRILSACRVPGDAVDFRESDAFQRAEAPMDEIDLPLVAEAICVKAMEACNLLFSGIDLKQRPDGSYVLLECNFSPAWRHVEERTGAPISEGLASYLVSL